MRKPRNKESRKGRHLKGVGFQMHVRNCALQQDGWYLRSDIVWYRPNCQPEWVKDRPTRSHEYLFLMTKAENYYYDYEAIREPANGSGQLKNRRTVWSISTDDFKGARFAVFPPNLVRLCILAGSRPDGLVLDPFFGVETVGVVYKETRRQCVGIEMKPEYAEMARSRIDSVPQQISIF